MRSLDEFYKYIEKQEQAIRERAEQTAAPTAPAPIVRTEKTEEMSAPPPVVAPPIAAPAAPVLAPHDVPAVPLPPSAAEVKGEPGGSAGAGAGPAQDAPVPAKQNGGASVFVPPPLPPKVTPRPSRYESILPPEALYPASPHAAEETNNNGHTAAGEAPPPSPKPSHYAVRAAAAESAGTNLPDIESYIPGLRKPTTEPESAPAAAEAPAADWEAEDALSVNKLEIDTADYLPPLVEEEPPQVVDAPARPRRARRTEPAPPPSLSEGEAAALWGRLPRHIQLLVGMNEPHQEVAQKYYTRGFKENRHQLIERLLDPTLSLEDTARILGVCPTTVRRYTNRGVLPHHRTVGHQRRFRLSDVLAFLEQQTDRGAQASAGGRAAAGEPAADAA